MPDIKEYVKRALADGHSEKEIRDYLLKKRYPIQDVNDAFKSSKPRLAISKFISPSVINAKTLETILGITFIAIIVIVILLTGSKTTKICEDDACFIQLANECKPVSIVKDEVGSFVLYEIKSTCVLEKSISNFAPDEPVEVITLFKDKKISCDYIKGEFDETMLTSIVSNIDSCTGDLKDAIFELKLAQYELLTE